jgi:hypothetical protein
MGKLSLSRKQFFETFSYLVFPGLLKWYIATAHEAFNTFEMS